ncbi:MAG: sialidase family protein [Planctomycetota bacterium]|nr:sialidase family protein [Planctomycetota bacterium]
MNRLLTVLSTTTILLVLAGPGFANDKLEGEIKPHLSDSKLDLQQIFAGERFPNIVVTPKGTIIATWGTSSLKSRRSTDGGETWGDIVEIQKPGFQSGGLTVNDRTGQVIVFTEAHHPPAQISVYISNDDGATFEKLAASFGKDSRGNGPDLHMNDNGITLRHSDYAGRLIRPSRCYAGKNDRSLWPKHYTNAVYSDDGGKTWEVSEPFPGFGFGEACIVELSNGTLYYNSRRHWAPEGKNPRRRWSATSTDGGKTWANVTFVEILPDGPQNTNYGCMGGLTRLPIKGHDILIYSNCDSDSGRNRGTVWASFDGGKTWPVKRQVFKGSFAYSAMTVGRPGTITEGNIYLNFEGGPQGGSTLATLNLAWILDGESTGDGEIPDQLTALTK